VSIVYDKVFSQWRSTTAFLLQSSLSRANRTPIVPDIPELQPKISKKTAVLNTILRDFVSRDVDNHEREANLEAIIKNGAKLGLALFSQSTAWKFDWGGNAESEVAQHQTQTIVTFPALVKITNNEGFRYRHARTALKAETAAW
jgi:hypothetical protein